MRSPRPVAGASAVRVDVVRASSWTACALAGVSLLALRFLLPRSGSLSVAPFDRYGEAFVHGAVPYRDFSVEYPPGAVPVFTLPALAPVSYELAFRLLQLVLGIALVCCVAYAVREARPARRLLAPVLVGGMPALLGPVVFFRYDLWPALLVVVAAVALDRRSYGACGVALGAAIAAKGYAFLLLPVYVLVAFRRSGRPASRRLLLAAGVTVLALVLPFLVLGPGGVAFSFRSQLERGLQIETLAASALLLLHAVGIGHPAVDFSTGSFNVTGRVAETLGLTQSAVLFALVLLVWAWVWRSRRDPDHTLVAASLVLVTVTFAKVLSPQYLIWVVPLVAVAIESVEIVVVGLLAWVLVLAQLVYPTLYDDLVTLHTAPAVLLAVRNLLLVVLAVLVLRRLARATAGR